MKGPDAARGGSENMPIYEYQCQDCGEQLEKLQRMSDDPLTDCPACGEAALKRLVSAAGFRLKGGGWYETDFKKGNQRNLAGSDSDSGGGKSSGESSKKSSESKADSKSAGKKSDTAGSKGKSGGNKSAATA